MTTAEKIKELANKLNEEANYYGAYFDEIISCRDLPFDEFKKACAEVDSRYPKINRDKATLLLIYLGNAALEGTLSPVN